MNIAYKINKFAWGLLFLTDMFNWACGKPARHSITLGSIATVIILSIVLEKIAED